MQIIILGIFFVLGLIIGSFLNVVIYRFNTHKSLGGRSACMSCQNKLQWFELIPLFSYLTLQGRCRTCKTKISVQYPLVELTSGIIFALIFLKLEPLFYNGGLSFAFTYAYYVLMFSLLLIISVYDIKHKIIPDILSLVFGALAFFGMFLFTTKGMYLHIPSLSQFIAGLAISVPFGLLWLVSGGRWMGFGDAKLAVGLGFFLGLPALLSGVAIAFWAGSIVGITLIFLNKLKGFKSEVPFVPFLVLGAAIAFFCELNFFLFL